ncbi:MAG TPA: hydantoinase/oxoprolinase family protein [Solirubrobacteraceae bacterium]|nr:hydantoinase/oxoprolinase family protein [Solirubrobacteraceae bacterium]
MVAVSAPDVPRTRSLFVAVDVGGTFTDLIAYDAADGLVAFAKVGSTPEAPARAVLEALATAGVPPDRMRLFIHGSTVGTNALLTRRLAHTAIVTTEGFRDVHEIRRGDREHLWDAYDDPPGPYVARRHRLEVAERVDHAGRVVRALDTAQAHQIAALVKRRGYESVAVCFVNAHMHPDHEAEMARIIAAAADGTHVSISSEVAPQIFEHERTATTVVNACLAPIVERYLTELQQGLRDRDYDGDVLVAHSGGGVMTAAAMARFAARIAKSGPAAGAIGMAAVAREVGVTDAIGLDIGGTSTDVSMMSAGRLAMSEESSVEFGQTILFPSVDVLTIGAGGGSIAWLDEGGALRSGPQSAGARPGPACYGLGGTRPTTTDAALLLGRLGSDTRLAGRVSLDANAAARAVATCVGAPLGISPREAAAAIVTVATAQIAEALRLCSIRRGLDPRDYALVAFGGAGPLLGAEVALDLGLREVIVPTHPGLTSALGGLLLDLRHDLSRSWIGEVESTDLRVLAEAFATLEAEARERLAAEGVDPAETVLERAVDLRYRGQWRSLSVGLDTPVQDELAAAVARFHTEHARRYGYARPGAPVEIHTLRVGATGAMPRPSLATLTVGGSVTRAPRRRADVWFPDGELTTAVIDRASIAPGDLVAGPALIDQMDTTTVVPPGTEARVDERWNLRIARC